MLRSPSSYHHISLLNVCGAILYTPLSSTLGSPLQAVHAYPTANAHMQRFRSGAWPYVIACSMLAFYQNALDATERCGWYIDRDEKDRASSNRSPATFHCIQYSFVYISHIHFPPSPVPPSLFLSFFLRLSLSFLLSLLFLPSIPFLICREFKSVENALTTSSPLTSIPNGSKSAVTMCLCVQQQELPKRS